MSKKNNDNNETFQAIEVSEGFIRWLMMNHLGKIYETERFYKILKDEMNNQFNIKCYDVTIGFRNDQDIFSEINNKEMIFTHGLISILLKCHQLKMKRKLLSTYGSCLGPMVILRRIFDLWKFLDTQSIARGIFQWTDDLLQKISGENPETLSFHA